MPGFDQRTWQAETTWEGELPTPAQAWTVLQAHDVAPSFRTALEGRVGASDRLKAMVVQHLLDTGTSADALADRLHVQAGLRLRASTLTRLSAMALERAKWKIAFANLVSGRFTELVFLRAYAPHLQQVGLELVEETVKRNFLDFRIVATAPGDDFELSLNTKNAGVQMAEAQSFFGLAPEDTLPMATYKTFGAEAAGIPPLLYVYLVDWTLIERLRHAYWRECLTEGERQVFRLIASAKGFPRNVEDDFIAATVDARLEELRQGVGYANLSGLPFRVVSAARCKQIFYENHGRSPYVFVKKMNTDPNVHISVSGETTSFENLLEQHLATPERRAALLEDLARQKQMAIPDPSL